MSKFRWPVRGLLVLCVPLFVNFLVFGQTTQTSVVNVSPQTGEAFVASVQLLKRLTPSVVLIKTGESGKLTGQGTGIVVGSDGLILTAYHVIKDAKQAQVTTKDGETYDRVEVLGVDERRDVAALRLPVKSLPPIAVRSVGEEQIGERVYTVSNPKGMNWTISEGLLSGVRLADDVAGAGKGFKLLQFTAPVSPGSSGGLLVDAQGRGIGLIVGGMNGQNLNFAVPLASVIGLGEQPGKGALASGQSLGQEKPEPEKIDVRKGQAVAVAEVSRTERIRDARLLYILPRTSLCKSVMLENALLQHTAHLDEWRIKVVQDDKFADLAIEIDNMPLTFYYTYKLLDLRARVVLAAGRVTAWDCNLAATEVAKKVMKDLGKVYATPQLKPLSPQVKKEKAAESPQISKDESKANR